MSNMSARRRDKLYVLAEIMELAENGILKTQLMHRANLSFSQLNDYVGFMLRIGMLQKQVYGKKEVYKGTVKGIDFLNRYREITMLLRSESDPRLCSNCHKEILEDQRFCPYCGKAAAVEAVMVKAR